MHSGGATPPTILVTDAGRGSAISIIRSLGRRGWRVVAGSADRTNLGFHSRYVAERLHYPSPARAPVEFVESIREAVLRHRVQLVIPVTDAAILPLAEDRSRFTQVCRLAIPESAALRVVNDKQLTLDLALNLGVPAPRSVVANSRESALEAAAALGWPVVLKPRSSRLYESRKSIEAFEVAYANHADDVAIRLEMLGTRCEVLVQEYYPGVGRGVGLLMHLGRPLAAFQHRRIHEVPLTGGASSLRESEVLDPELYEYSVRLLSALHWTGLAMVEFKMGHGGAKLMEINGRVWGSLPLAVMSGVDFPRLLAELYLSGPPESGIGPQIQYRAGVRARNLELDFVWIASVLGGRHKYPFLRNPNRGVGLTGLLGLLDPRNRSDNQALDDPLPGLAEIPLALGKLISKLGERS